MKPEDYFRNFVLPSAREYCEAEEALTKAAVANATTRDLEIVALRKAANAAVAAWHMADWMWEQSSSVTKMQMGVSSLDAYRQNVEHSHCKYLRTGKSCNDFNLIGSVADAFKHFQLKNKKREIETADSVGGMSTGWGDGLWGEGKWGGVVQVTITQRDLTNRAFSSVLQNSIDMWRRHLNLPLADIGEF